MTELQPYSLRAGACNSNDYYTTVALFADGWLAYVQSAAGDLVEAFRAFRRSAGLPEQSLLEDTFELLVLGVLQREHGAEAAASPGWLLRALKKLVELQERWPRAERAIKTLRGLLGGMAGCFGQRQDLPAGACQALGRLRLWLQAQGQLTQAGRLAIWQDYFAHAGPEHAQETLALALTLADDFARKSGAALGRYSAGVESYRAAAAGQVRFRYDASLVLRTRLEYHLGMLGTELLNRAYRASFLAAPVKIVIVPPCLRPQPNEAGCRAIQTPLGAQCQGCRPDCRIHQLTKLGEKSGFAVYSIPDDELQKVCLASGQAGGKVGVVGLSCALTNWNAGWEASRLGLPAQGLLLDHAGCQKHWRRPGISTDTNFARLQLLMQGQGA